MKAPESEEAPIPVYGGHVYNGKDTSGDLPIFCMSAVIIAISIPIGIPEAYNQSSGIQNGV